MSHKENEMENKIITAEYRQATELHSKIMANAEIAAGALLEMCQGLKQMRDTKLYLQLNMPTFDAYCEDKVGIKARQAYTYISTYEKLGSTVLQSNANLGITKLELIAQLPAPDRAAELAEGTFEGMSVKEIKELVRKNKEQAEQLELLSNDKQAAKNHADEVQQKYIDLLSASEQNKSKIEKLNQRITELESMPVEVARELTADEKADIRKQITAEVRAEFDAELGKENTMSLADMQAEVEKSVREAQEKAKLELEEAVKAAQAKSKEKLKKLKEDEKQAVQKYKAAQDKIASLQKQVEIADPAKAKVLIYFEALKKDYNEMITAITELSAEDDKEKFTTAVYKMLQLLANNLKQEAKE